MAKKKSLGKGLSALIKNTSLDESTASGYNNKKKDIKNNIVSIDINKIKPNPEQARTVFDQQKLKELAASIKNVGLISPVVLQRNKNKYIIIAGERRWRAARLAGFNSIPSIINNDVRDNSLAYIMIENLQREDLTPVEEANGYQQLLHKKSYTHQKLARTLSKSRTHITNMLRILKLPSSVQNSINQGRLSSGHAKVLSSLPAERAEKTAADIIKKNLSVRETEKLLQKKVPRRTSTAGKKKANIFLKEVEDKLRSFFQTKTRIIPVSRNKGKIEIEYYSTSDINEILRKLKL
ncbi:MAG TPA: ParB/RepB/Spo0J family partition protein [Spirochaetota bacterium]|nr:ParB/RepB/Spo0J family partition protein [Spirochaetota bacterium]